jgi:tetratricopeptide (TPR) repeat protein
LVGNLTGASEALPQNRDPAQWSPRQVPVEPDPYAKEPGTWLWTPAIGKRKEEGFARQGARDQAGALSIFEALLTEVPDDPQIHQMLAIIYRTVGRLDDAARELDWLRRAYRDREGYWTGSALLAALHDHGRWQETIEIAKRLLERFPEAAQVWNLLATAQWQLGRVDEASASVDRSVALRFNRWAYFNRHKIHFLGRNDVDAAIRTQFDLYVIENDAEFLAQNLREFAPGNHHQRVVELARQHDCDPVVRGRLVEIAEAFARERDQSQPAATLAAHLERVFVAARNAGAEPVVLCYPWRTAASAVLRAAAEEHAVPFFDVESEFAARTAGREGALLRAPDGHCNDAGYAIMTAIIAERLLPLLR